MIVHVLHHGLPRCGFSIDVPREWPGEHRWISLDEYRIRRQHGTLATENFCEVCVSKLGPQRIQRSRARGWRMPKGAIYVGRPTEFGNPFLDWQHPKRENERGVMLTDGTSVLAQFNAADDGAGREHDCVWYFERWVLGELPALRGMIRLTDRALKIRKSLPMLRGQDLVCWCPRDRACHADVLIRLANAPREP